MSIRCKNGTEHTHETVQESRACWQKNGNYRTDAPGGRYDYHAHTTGERSGPFAGIPNEADHFRNTPMETLADQQAFVDSAPVNAPMRVEPNRPPSPAQLWKIKKLLREHCLVADFDLTTLTPGWSGTASALIGDLLKWKPGMPLWSGLRLDEGKLSADGDPAGYGDPQNVVDDRPLPDIPAGHYAIKSLTGNNDLDFFRVDRKGEDGKGRTFIKRVIGGRPDKNIRFSQYRDVLECIEVDIEGAAILYGQQIGRCYRCNRHLTDELSRKLGIGPDCRSK